MRFRAAVLSLAVTTLFFVASPAASPAQDPAQAPAGPRQQGTGGGAGFAGMERIGGEVTAISGNNVTVKAVDGKVFQIVTTDNTRLMRGRGVAIKLAELKVGDGVMAMGNLDAPKSTLHAAMIFATSAEQVKALRDNLGKTFIAGKVTAIDLDNAKMTVERQDKVSQVIGFDETTSFKRGRAGRGGANALALGAPATQPAAPGAAGGESITLADIKVGDTVMGQGALKNGTFVPTELTVSTPGQGRRNGGAAPGAEPARPGPGTGPGTK